jgi:hypothetical protein
LGSSLNDNDYHLPGQPAPCGFTNRNKTFLVERSALPGSLRYNTVRQKAAGGLFALLGAQNDVLPPQLEK